ncbi:MAG: hypothetical protein PHR28_05320 [candidate division Zixibacteria bacterium]|nr:hypothetical protein [candidate division Zixibacteria bacterium]
MKRLLIFTVLLAVLIGGAVFATETRVNTMGNVNTVVKDEANIFMFPSTINYYPKLFAAEVGERSEYYIKDGDEYDVYLNRVGAHFQLGQKSEAPWVLGAYFDTRVFYPSIVDYLAYWNDDYYKDADEGYWNTNHRLTAVVGHEFNAMPVGLIFSYYNMGQKGENATTTVYDESISRMELSLGLSPMQKKLDIGFGVAMTTWKDKTYDGAALVDNTKPKGNMDLFVNARYWFDPMGKYTMVPHFGIMYSKQGAEGYTDGVLENTYKIKDIIFDLGWGMNYDAAENVLVVGDFGFQMDNYKTTSQYTGDPETEYKDNYLYLPYFRIGIDAYVFKWMNLRGGVESKWAWNKYQPNATQTEKYKYSETETFLGAGFHWGNFTIDANIDPDFLSRGPYFITGSNNSNEYDISNKISLKYMFD